MMKSLQALRKKIESKSKKTKKTPEPEKGIELIEEDEDLTEPSKPEKKEKVEEVKEVKDTPEERMKQIVAEYERLQNAGVFRTELLYQLVQINFNMNRIATLFEQVFEEEEDETEDN